MSTKPHLLVTFLLDRSGSMSSCKAATIEAFNGYVDTLRAEKDAEIDFTFLQFDSQSLDKIHVAKPIANVKNLTDQTYQPRSSTPLVDASVKTINAVAASLSKRDDKPKVVVCIQTDGHENCSTEHTWEELKGLIAAKQSEGWEFNFMGAGIDAYTAAQSMGVHVNNTVSYDHNNLHATRSVFAASAMNAAAFGAGRMADTQYSVGQKLSAGDAHASRYDSRMGGKVDLDLTTKAVAPKKADTVAGGFTL